MISDDTIELVKRVYEDSQKANCYKDFSRLVSFVESFINRHEIITS